MEACMFCLDQGSQENTVITFEFKDYYRLTTCSCRFHTHISCWMSYLLHKGRTECPICHRVYDVNTVPSLPQGYIIVENPIVRRRPIVEPDTSHTEQSNIKCILFLSIFLVFLMILLVMRL
jgi:hypothetical protein